MHANKGHFKTAVTVIDAHSLQRWFKPQSAHWEKKALFKLKNAVCLSNIGFNKGFTYHQPIGRIRPVICSVFFIVFFFIWVIQIKILEIKIIYIDMNKFQ